MNASEPSFNMMIRLSIAALIVLSVFALNASAFAGEGVMLPEQKTASALPSADIEAFVRSGCPHCAKAELFLQALNREQPALRIVIHDVSQDPAHLDRLQNLAKNQGIGTVRVPAFQVGGQLIIGYSDALTTGQLIRGALAQERLPAHTPKNLDTSGSCEAEETVSCEAGTDVSAQAAQPFMLDFLGHRLSLEETGLPLFTLAMGLLDGFNPCSMWVLILMISLLAPMNNRPRMFAIAGTFIAVEGIAYFIFMSAP